MTMTPTDTIGPFGRQVDGYEARIFAPSNTVHLVKPSVAMFPEGWSSRCGVLSGKFDLWDGNAAKMCSTCLLHVIGTGYMAEGYIAQGDLNWSVYPYRQGTIPT